MPYWQESDTFHDDPRWPKLAAGHAVTVDQLQAAYCRLMSIAGRHATNGWLTHETAASLAKPKVIERLAAKGLSDQPPMLHRKGDKCSCFEEWLPGYDFCIHWFLKRNPHKRETERYRKQKSEASDPRLRAQVYERDAGCCRYCRSGPLKKSGMGNSKDRRRVIHYDHVDPDELAGPDAANLIVSCARCNESNGRRTPDEPDMVLLPIPTADERQQWQARGEARLDPPQQRRDSAQTAVSTADPAAVDTAVPSGVPAVDTEPSSTGEVRPATGQEQQRQRPPLSPEGSGSGRGGQPACVDQPPRNRDTPDVYHRRSRAPTERKPL